MNLLWFRRGLRLHDNPALLSALKNSNKFAAVFIFDHTGILTLASNKLNIKANSMICLNSGMGETVSLLQFYVGVLG